MLLILISFWSLFFLCSLLPCRLLTIKWVFSIHHRFVETSELLASFTARSLSTRCGTRCWNALRKLYERDAANILVGWWRSRRRRRSHPRTNMRMEDEAEAADLDHGWRRTLIELREKKRERKRRQTYLSIRVRRDKQERKKQERASIRM